MNTFSIAVLSSIFVYYLTRYYYQRSLKDINDKYYSLLQLLREHDLKIKQKTDDIKYKLQILSDRFDNTIKNDIK
jgi:hypothetical protein